MAPVGSEHRSGNAHEVAGRLTQSPAAKDLHQDIFHIRVRFLHSLLLTLSALASLGGLIHLFALHSLISGSVLLGLGALWFGVASFKIRPTNYAVFVSVFLLIGLIGTLSIVLLTGMTRAPGLPLLLFPPSVAFCLLDRRERLLWVLLFVVTLVGVLFVDLAQIELPNLFANLSTKQIKVNRFLVLLFFSGSVFSGLNTTLKYHQIMHHEYKRKNEDLERYMQIISHDLVSPVNNIGTLTRMLLEEDLHRGVADVADELQMIQSLSYKSKTLIRSLNEYHRSVNQDAELQDINLDRLIAQLRDETLNAPHSNKLHFEVVGTVGQISGDPTQLSACFRNVVNNAIKYNDKPEKHLRIELRRQSSIFKVSITDNGLGIAKDELGRIFGAYQRVDTPNSGEGLGLGLSFVKYAVEQHGGRISVSSELGAGTCFTFEFPLKR